MFVKLSPTVEQYVKSKFSAKTLRALRKNGIQVIGASHDTSASYGGETLFHLNVNGTGCVRSYLQVLAMT